MSNLRFTRRRLLIRGGAGVFGIAILATGCSDSKSPTANKTDPAGGPSTSGPSAAPSRSPAGPPVDFGGWNRVSLDFVSAYLLVRGGEAAVVDLGTPGSGGAIEAGLQAAGVGWNAVRHVILTHQHQDHAGGTPEVAPKVTAGSIYSGAADVVGIRSPTTVKPLNDGDEVFGLRIIGTPGHTKGHIAVFEPSAGVLVAGDALRTNSSGLLGPDPRNSLDQTQATASVRKLAALDVRIILPGHGDPLTTGAGDALRKLAAG